MNTSRGTWTRANACMPRRKVRKISTKALPY
ncbi:MAG: hypothetical protein ACI9JM_002951, partial [Halioglobus sp.]